MAKVELRGDRLTPPLLSPTPMVDNTAWIIHEPSVCPKGWAGAAAAEALAPPRVRHPQTKHFRGFSTADPPQSGSSPELLPLIRNPADQCVGELGGVTAGHQAKWVAALITSGLSARVRQRSLNAASRSLSVAKCSFATASSASGQRCSAGCSSGV